MLSYAGFCRQCQQSHAIFATPQAQAAAQALFDAIKETGRLDFEQPFEDPRAFVIDAQTKLMLGVLVTNDGTVLRAFSGQMRGYSHIAGFVEPLHPRRFVPGRRTEAEAEIEALSAAMADLPSHTAHGLRQLRKTLSQRVMERLFDETVLQNFRGTKKTLRQAHLGGGIPSGTGDCCAPKLLQAAARCGLTPTGLVEFAIGRHPDWLQRPLQTQPACQARCAPILGFLLCGLP